MSRKPIAKCDEFIWRLIEDHNYLVLWSGEIMALRKGKWVNAQHVHKSNTHSYYCVAYKGKNLRAHRIVFHKFIGDLDPHLTINHRDGNTFNNSVENLEMVSMSQNSRHSYLVLGSSPHGGTIKLSKTVAKKIRESYEGGSRAPSLAAQYGVGITTIVDVIKNRTWKVG